MTSGYGLVASGYWPAIVLGAVELLILITYTTGAARRELHRRRDASTPIPVVRGSDDPSRETDDRLPRCRGLIAEAMIVRERVSGQIDAATYQKRMTDLARGGRS